MARINTVLHPYHKVELLKQREASLIEAIADLGFSDDLFDQLLTVQFDLAEAKALIQ